MNIQNLIDLRKYLTIKEHVKDNEKGKISLQFSIQALLDPKVMEIINENKNTPKPEAIYNTSIQKLRRIITIEYNSNIIIPSEFEDILTTRNREHFNQLVEKYLSILT